MAGAIAIRSQRDRRRRRDVERLGALGAAGSSPGVAALDRSPAGRPSRSAPRQTRRRPRLERSRAARRRGRPAPLAAPGSSSMLARARAAGRRPTPCSPAPPSASRDRRSPARARRSRPTSACAVRMIVPTLPGIADAVQVDAGRLARLAPSAARQTPIARVPEPSVRPREQLRLDLRAAQALARRREQLDRLAPAACAAADQVLALGDEQALALAACAARACGSASASRCGGW